MAEKLVVDASAMVDYLVDSPLSARVADRIADNEILVPAHFDAEVLSALGRLQRGAELSEAEVQARVALTAQAPFHRNLLAPLLEGAWARRHDVRLVDALYIELAGQADATVITPDSGMSTRQPTQCTSSNRKRERNRFKPRSPVFRRPDLVLTSK